MAPAPPAWALAPARDTLFILVTGANSGVGLGICERLIDTFLTDRPLTSHLVLLPTTRSARKAEETVAHLRTYLRHADATNAALRTRGARGPTAGAGGALERVHIAAVQFDLCDLASVRRAAAQLVGGTVAFGGTDGSARRRVAIPRLDAAIFNAGVGGWSHISWPGFARHVLAAGWVHATTRPLFKRAVPGLAVNPLPGVATQAVPELGLVFCANVFGHYLLAHWLVPLLERRRAGAGAQPPAPPAGRIIWQSSVDPHLGHFDPADLQGLRTTGAYESSKMLTDILALTAAQPGVQPVAARFLAHDAAADAVAAAAQPPRMYLAHPGIVATTIMPLHCALRWAYVLGVRLSRWLGSPWHAVTPRTAAAAAAWLALAGQGELDARRAERCKWGSCTDFWGTAYVKKTEVDGWGWDGRVESAEAIAAEDAAVPRVLRKSVGRWIHAELVTEEKRAAFDELGAQCWKKMEEMRAEWEERLDSLVAK